MRPVDTLRSFCARPGTAVLLDEASGLLLDVPSGKTLGLRLSNLAQLEPRHNAQTGQPYLVVVWDDGRQVALAGVGVAFAPDLRSTGPVEGLPPVVCWKDFATLRARLEHGLYGHPEAPASAELVSLTMGCIAMLDGARAVGFSVEAEERALDEALAELERRGRG